MTKSRWFERVRLAGSRNHLLVMALAVSASLLAGEATSWAQAVTSPNAGALTFTGGFDVASLYVFRGLVQEQDPKFTAFPYGDVGIALTSGEGTLRGTAVNFGVWNSLNTGSSGTNGPSGHAHYEEQFYTRVNLLFRGGVTVGAGYMARTSPNNMLDTEKEFQLRVAKTGRLIPYLFLASELSDDGQADGGTSKGTYLELGATPNVALGGGKATLTIPAKLGFSVKDYYELAGTDHKFGFVNVGAMLTLPLKKVPARFGSWNVHGGGEVYVFGDTPKAVNDGKVSKVVGSLGIGLFY